MLKILVLFNLLIIKNQPVVSTNLSFYHQIPASELSDIFRSASTTVPDDMLQGYIHTTILTVTILINYTPMQFARDTEHYVNVF